MHIVPKHHVVPSITCIYCTSSPSPRAPRCRPPAEALLHQFLGRNSAASLHLGTGQTGDAASAALRRASDLLAICSDARKQAAGGRGSATPLQDGTLALCRKQFFAGASTDGSGSLCLGKGYRNASWGQSFMLTAQVVHPGAFADDVGCCA